ncbi:MAG: maltose alpha-D-glucosyltransferase / alpha-amylase [Chthoniobacter sp.]|jgi:maltose alpha-D-glucosyltransferase/alpha-amylase|nr:maltose alpha-D-glucosyltransferase / alpha-amylase [Chthoniobacter sp.]
MSNPLWFKDATIYQLHVKTFQDSDGDGLGDFRGLLDRLDYFTELGVTALWLLPFYPSPLRDDGYDIADYYSVNPSFGTIDDFKAFLDEAHNRGLRVITELVLNHTSDQNPWFQRARRAPVGSPERDFYVWSDDPRKYSDARIIFKDFETSNWTWDPVAKAYFWHRFYFHQPDLNFDNLALHEELFRVIDFWLEMGVDGVRLDAVPYLYERENTNCENLPETHAFLRKLRAHMDGKFADRMLLAEANQWPEDAAAYFGKGDECQMNFHFPLMPRMFMALQMEDRYPIIDILEQTPAIPPNCQWAIFLRNHDELTLEMVTDEERDYMYRVYAEDPRARINLGIRRRLAPLLGNNRRKIELINSLLFSLPGTPIIYYGDEIGMGDNFYLGDRNGVRTPMQWTPDRNAGFSKANPQQLYLPTIIDPEYHYESVNVENQQKNVSSLFWWMRRLLNVRQRSAAFARGTIEFIQPDNAKVLVYLRRLDQEVILVVANLSRFVQVVELDLSPYAGQVPEELFGRTIFPEIKPTPTVFTLTPHGFYWLALRPTAAAQAGQTAWSAPAIAGNAAWGPALWTRLEREVLPAYLPTCRWFGGKGRILRDLKVSMDVPIGGAPDAARLVIVEVAFTEGLPESYAMPLAFADEKAGKQLALETPHAVLARFPNEQVLCDALHLPQVRRDLLELIAKRTPNRARTRLVGVSRERFDEAVLANGLAHARLLSVEQSNSSIIYGETWFLKVFRKFERGPNPDMEISRFLGEEGSFNRVPPYAGALQLVDPEGEGVVAVLTGFTANQGDGWSYTLDAVERFLERALAARVEFNDINLQELIGGVYPERARQLGQRTGELHRALASGVERPEFAPEPFSTLYQRSLYQALRGAAGKVLRQLRRQLSRLPEAVQKEAALLVESQPRLLDGYSRLLDHKIAAVKIRVHGDFHLGQVLNTGKDFVIMDFEGEPRRTIGERLLKRSPLVDVAGMLRSFDYAGAVALRLEAEADIPRLEPWARAWVNAACGSFLAGYFGVAGDASFLPADRADMRLLLEAFLLEKAVYEVGYELSYRPDFLSIPLRAVLRLVAGSDSALEHWA